jgi:hypothetical protein
MERMKKTAPTEVVGCILTAGREGKMGILVQLLGHSAEGERYLQPLRSERQTAAQEHCHAHAQRVPGAKI